MSMNKCTKMAKPYLGIILLVIHFLTMSLTDNNTTYDKKSTEHEYGSDFDEEDQTSDNDIFSTIDDPYINPNPDDDEDSLNELLLTKALLNESTNEMSRIPIHIIINSLWAINRLDISLKKKLQIWEMVKNSSLVQGFTRYDLEKTGNLLLVIPEIDLYNLNYSDWNIIDYLGTLPGLGRRRAGIIGYALKQKWGTNMLSNTEIINKIKGLLCAFSPSELYTISPQKLCRIGKAVFQNLGSCTKRQLKVLLYIAMDVKAYGPTQAWNKRDTEKLALLLTALEEDDLIAIRVEAMEGVDYTVIQAMPKEKLEWFCKEQISHLNGHALAAYRRLTGIDSNKSKNLICFTVIQNVCVCWLCAIFLW